MPRPATTPAGDGGSIERPEGTEVLVQPAGEPADPFEDVTAIVLSMPWGDEFSPGRDTPFTLGRDATISPVASRLPDNVSHRHAHIVYGCSGWFVEDLGSTNGTFLNDTRLKPWTQAAIVPGDVIRLGSDPPVPVRVLGSAT